MLLFLRNYLLSFKFLVLFQVTGLMLHYANGKPVVGEEADRSHVIHVHSKCIEWYVILSFEIIYVITVRYVSAFN